VNILAVNWQDRENPNAGGAEIHLFEIFGRLLEVLNETGAENETNHVGRIEVRPIIPHEMPA